MKFSLQTRAEQELSFKVRENQIQWVKSTNDLFSNFSQNFCWDILIESIVKKDLQNLDLIRRVLPAETNVNV